MSVRKSGSRAVSLNWSARAGGDEVGPVLEFGLPDRRLVREIERPHLLAQDFRVEERFGFDSHLPGKRLCGPGKKPSVFLLGRR